jgi:primary-amine oxidase
VSGEVEHDAERAFQHPLDPLSKTEIREATRLAREAGALPDLARIVSVSLEEPTRAELAELEGGAVPARRARVSALDPGRHEPLEVFLDLTSGKVERAERFPGSHTPITPEDYEACMAVVRRDPQVLEALRKRGIDDPQKVLVDSWGLGDFRGSAARPERLVWTLLSLREQPSDNPFAKPLTGLYAIVDLDAMRVLEVHDEPSAPLPAGNGRYDAGAVSPLRPDLRPVEISQPEGVSFELRGQEVRWQKWSLRVGFNAREGLTIHQVNYRDGERVRPILSRASLAELVVPYADPRPFEGWRNAFDIGEYGVGTAANSLALGCDCLGAISYLDADLANDKGEPYRIANAICIHEEDSGLLWKHYDEAQGRSEVRRSRRLVISFIFTANNYDYACYWYFYQDGTLELEVKLTGVVLTSAIAPGQTSTFGTVVAPGTLAAHHQHFFSVRLDMTVDGPTNRVEEVETVAVPTGPDNPLGNAFTTSKTVLSSELSARRLMDPLHGRHWLVSNRDSTNSLGQPVAYKLVPGANSIPFASSEASVRRRARFLDHHLWVTRYDPSQRYPAGEYPNQSAEDSGLPVWTAADRPLVDEELVLWYTMGSHHITRPEDWPVMPVERIGFLLKPVGFFDQSPALDVPPPAQHEDCAPASEG